MDKYNSAGAIKYARDLYPAGHVRVSEISVSVRRDPPKIIAHHPILVERASCPQRPHDCNYSGKADGA
jgi:hypothetical protein